MGPTWRATLPGGISLLTTRYIFHVDPGRRAGPLGMLSKKLPHPFQTQLYEDSLPIQICSSAIIFSRLLVGIKKFARLTIVLDIIEYRIPTVITELLAVLAQTLLETK